MKNFSNFRLFIKKNRNNIVIKGVKAKWPYNYGGKIGYEVTLKDKTIYFFFNCDGIMLTNNVIRG